MQQNFPIRTGETAFLFLQHFIKILKAGGRGGIVIKNTFLSNTDNASVSLRKLLLESCNLHTVLDCPGGTFQGAGVKTVVLFFEKGSKTRKVWFYSLDPGRNLGKTNPLNDDDLAEFVKLQKTFADSPKSWSVDAKTIDQTDFDLSVKNPNGGEEITHRSPAGHHGRNRRAGCRKRRSAGKYQGTAMNNGWQTKNLNALYQIGSSKRVLKSQWKTSGVPFYRGREVTRLSADGFVENELFISEAHFAELSKEYGVPKAGDIVITAIGTIGNSHVVRSSDRFYFKDASVLWMKRTSDVSSEFVNLWLKSPSFFDQLDRGNGATVDTLTIQKLQSVEISLPPPAEQQRIVGILDEAFEGIATAKANAEKNLQNARALFESHLQSVFTQRGKGWIEKKLGDMSRINYGYTESASWENIGPKFLRITDIQDNRVDWSSVPTCRIEASDYPKYKLADGDIVFARTGATTGKSYLVAEPPEAVFASYLIRVQLSAKELLPQFVNLFFQTPSYWDSIRAGVSGSAQGGFNATKLGELVIPFPQSSKDQKTIIAKLDELSEETQRLASLYERKLDELEALKQSLLHQAFTGQLGASKMEAA